ncbi:hypothetical protein M413DRAFT_407291 [Hebeloma cylindrosporum]|uniref:DEAD/DEAH-box helicase domain-containing protein n=1 Tax=Hebeloma cylindrosporum TaxID=76867 RepID=A0A0C3CZU0_HEBCY|nr:hypothetical protein M413DRAFT_407291 [Hebeloma cylindrosporum h7]
MDYQYYEDPIEPYEQGVQSYSFQGTQEGISSPFEDYDDDQDFSSPTPLPRFDRNPRHPQETSYGRPVNNSYGFTNALRNPSQGILFNNAADHRPGFSESSERNNGAPSIAWKEVSYDATHNGVNDRAYGHQGPQRSTPRNSHGIRLRPVSDMPDIYRGVFKFGVFNAIQSICFDEVIGGNKNLVINGIVSLSNYGSWLSWRLAPTGSGKTVIFELGIIRMLEQSKKTGKQAKCVYVAPTKALCTERFQDWVSKFEPIGLKCCELTGDTVIFGHNTWGDARNASIMFVLFLPSFGKVFSPSLACIA